MKRSIVLSTALCLIALLISACVATRIPEGEGSIIVDVTAKGGDQPDIKAELFVNDEFQGETAIEAGKAFCIYIDNGEHILRVEAEGFETIEESVIVRGMNPGTWFEAKMVPIDPPQTEEEPDE